MAKTFGGCDRDCGWGRKILQHIRRMFGDDHIATACNERVMPMKVRKVVRLLERAGWTGMRRGGPAIGIFKHPDRVSVITVFGNDGKELAPGTLNDMLNRAGLE